MRSTPWKELVSCSMLTMLLLLAGPDQPLNAVLNQPLNAALNQPLNAAPNQNLESICTLRHLRASMMQLIHNPPPPDQLDAVTLLYNDVARLFHAIEQQHHAALAANGNQLVASDHRQSQSNGDLSE